MSKPERRPNCAQCTNERAHNSMFCPKCRCKADIKNSILNFANSKQGLQNLIEQIESLNILTCRRLETIGQERNATKLASLANYLRALQVNNGQPDLLTAIMPSLKQAAGTPTQ